MRPTNKVKKKHKNLDTMFWKLANERNLLLVKMEIEVDAIKKKAYNGKIVSIDKQLLSVSSQFNYSRNINNIG